MALFGRKKGEDTSAEVEGAQADTKKAKGRRRGKGAADILDETVLESAIATLRENDAFTGTRDGKPVYIALCVMLPDIGGIDKKSLRDEEKGQLIEGLNHGKIKALITPELLAEDRLVLIPTPETLKAMQELAFLADPCLTYRLVAVDDEGNIDDLSVGVSFDEVFDIGTSEDQSIMDTLVDMDIDWAVKAQQEMAEEDFLDEEDIEGSGEIMSEADLDEVDLADMDEIDFDAPDLTTPMEVQGRAEEPVLDEPQPAPEAAQAPVAAPIASPTAPQPVPEGAPALEGPDAVVAAEAPAPVYQQVPSQAQAPVAAQAQVADVPIDRDRVLSEVNRIFSNTDLGIEITTEPFDAHFADMDEFIGFEEPDETWLDGYVAQMVRNANSELRRLHQQNLLKAKRTYLSLVDKLCRQLDQELSVDDESTRFGRLYRQLQQKRDDGRANLAQTVADRRSAVTAEWEAKAEAEAQAAAAAARQNFESRQGRVREAELHRIEREEREKVEDHFADDVRDMHSARRAEAQKQLTRIMNQVIAQVSEQYMKDIEDEHAEYMRWRDEMSSFIDSARQDQVAHDQVLAEELRQNERAEHVVRDYKARLETSQREAEAVAARLRDEIADMQRRTDQVILEKDKEIEQIQSGHVKEREAFEAQLDEMRRRYAELDEKKEQEWAVRVKAVTDERDMWASQTNALVESHKHQRGVTIALVVAAVVAALAVGFVAGIMGDFSTPTPVEIQAHVDTPYTSEEAVEGLGSENVGSLIQWLDVAE